MCGARRSDLLESPLVAQQPHGDQAKHPISTKKRMVTKTDHYSNTLLAQQNKATSNATVALLLKMNHCNGSLSTV